MTENDAFVQRAGIGFPLVTTAVDPAFEAAVPVRAALGAAAERLAVAGVPDPTVDAELLLAHVIGAGRGEVQAAALRGDELDGGEAAAFADAVQRRASREPLQHITGVAPFRHLELLVGPGVFVPRPETEMVAQLAIDALRAVPEPDPVAVDLCTGSGAIALALATEVPHARVHAVENSVDAFIWAKENAARVGAPNLRLVFDDATRALPELDGTVAVLVTNPPYVPDDAIPRDPEVRLHDPEAALYGGADGLDVVRGISRRALALVRPGGSLIIEHGEWQGESIRELLTADGWRAAATHPDLTSRDRATTALRP
ncbi:peptide chain release factor N(5)-glutamine methyltransferase [Microbacterium sp. Marseille-Q6965]|uniref:peptide chain release factor N(5)-glutamine methyltransferase n=1 Tax=Microbacterium sp. Marseille-Q6965 TaxID=2965072 RepID=UPI0021B7AE6C|nr:peptide chain release factor N(5)-glutamine methyltransferase [Microbacterium sp. Marseille-Q6965]